MVSPNLVTLRLFLDALDVPSVIDTVDDRKRVQKAVYLGQLTGVDLGYRFSWYLMGPYSPDLTRDYYMLREALESDAGIGSGRRLRPVLSQKLGQVQSLLQVPDDVGLTQEAWLELLASVDYLQRVSKQSSERIRDTIMRQKPHLENYLPQAIAVLNGAKEASLIRSG